MSHVANNTGNMEWGTPPEILELVWQVFEGPADLDPASSADFVSIVKARKHFTTEEDGLLHLWVGKVWLNPPYARGIIQNWAEKFLDEYQSGRMTEGFFLSNNATDTAWFNVIAPHAAAMCFFRRRLKYLRPDGSSGPALQGQVIQYFGPHAHRFIQVFQPHGLLVTPHKKGPSW